MSQQTVRVELTITESVVLDVQVDSIRDVDAIATRAENAARRGEGQLQSRSVTIDDFYLTDPPGEECPQCHELAGVVTGGFSGDIRMFGGLQGVDLTFYRCAECDCTWAD